MQIGVNTLLWTAGFRLEHLPLIGKVRSMGLDGIELATFDFASFPAAAARRELAACGMPGILCSALIGGMSLATEDAALRAQSLEFLKAGVRATAEAGLSLFIGPFCSAVGYLPGRRRTVDEWARCVEGLRELGSYCDAFGVRVAVEPLNRFETFFLNTAADALALCEAVAHPRREPMIEWLNGKTVEVWRGTANENSELPDGRDATVTAAWIGEVLARKRAVPAAITHQIQCCTRATQ